MVLGQRPLHGEASIGQLVSGFGFGAVRTIDPFFYIYHVTFGFQPDLWESSWKAILYTHLLMVYFSMCFSVFS